MNGRWSLPAWGALLTLALTASGLDPFQTLYRLNREGILALEKQDPATAIERYSKALEMAPRDPRLLFNLAGAQAQAGQIEEARRNWERAAELGDSQVRRDALYNRGVAGLAARQFGPAAGDFARALNVDPADKEARRNLELALRRLAAQPPQPDQPQSRQEDRDGSGKQPPQPNNQPDGDSSAKQPPQEASSSGAEKQPEAEPNEAGKAAERLLDTLQREETEAMQRALRRRHADQPPREKDW